MTYSLPQALSWGYFIIAPNLAHKKEDLKGLIFGAPD